jgi:hypothetical protein
MPAALLGRGGPDRWRRRHALRAARGRVDRRRRALRALGDRSGTLYTFSATQRRRHDRNQEGGPYLDAAEERGLLSTANVCAVGPDGTVWVGGYEGVLSRFSPDRKLAWASAGARKLDRDPAE